MSTFITSLMTKVSKPTEKKKPIINLADENMPISMIERLCKEAGGDSFDGTDYCVGYETHSEYLDRKRGVYDDVDVSGYRAQKCLLRNLNIRLKKHLRIEVLYDRRTRVGLLTCKKIVEFELTKTINRLIKSMDGRLTHLYLKSKLEMELEKLKLVKEEYLKGHNSKDEFQNTRM